MGSERPDSGAWDNFALSPEATNSIDTTRSENDKKAARIAEIHRIALAAFHGEAELRRPYRLIAELKALQDRWLQGPEVLEALIMMRVMTKSRPANTVGTLQRLKSLRESGGTPELFYEFEARVKDHLGGRALSNHGYDKFSFEEMDHQPVWFQINSHIETLKQAGYQVFLNSGTLLGVIRDGQLIAHDNDVDLAVMLQAQNPKDAAAEWLALGSLLADTGMLDEEQTDGQEIYKLPAVNGVQIDLFPCWIQDSRVYVYPHTFGEMDEAELLPLTHCKLHGNPIPKNAEKMLALNYGEGWKKPDPHFVFQWRAAKQRFSTFLSGVA